MSRISECDIGVGIVGNLFRKTYNQLQSRTRKNPSRKKNTAVPSHYSIISVNTDSFNRLDLRLQENKSKTIYNKKIS